MSEQNRSETKVIKSIGNWYNTSRESRMVSHFEIVKDDDGLWMEAHGAEGGVHPGPWDRAWVEVFSRKLDAPEDDGLFTEIDLGEMRVSFSIYYNHGILVVAGHTIFQDDSGRPGWFTREFYYKSPNTPWK